MSKLSGAVRSEQGQVFIKLSGSLRCTTLWTALVAYAKPNAKLPERTVNVLCAKCRTRLYKYHKNGNGKLVKCWHERIAVDYTHKDLKCPACGQQFARETMIRGLPANKIVGGKVILKR